jgi:hypothetical protein
MAESPERMNTGLGPQLETSHGKENYRHHRRSLKEGAILFNEYAIDSWGWNLLAQSKLFDLNKKLSKICRARTR